MAFNQNFTTGFNPALFLYLNPTLNLSSVEEASTYSNIGGYMSNIDTIPAGLDPDVFISENRQNLDVSTLNNAIKDSILLQGGCLDDGVYYPTIYRSCINVGSNVFQINRPGEVTFNFSACNLRVSDEIKIVKNTGQSFYGHVDNIIDFQTFSVVFQGGGIANDMSSAYDYILYGIKLYDPLRLARIGYLSLFGTTPSNQVNIDSNFNYKLYELLYPDSANLNKEEAFLDFTNRRGNNDLRIASVDDIKCGASNGNGCVFTNGDITYLKVTQHLDLSFGQETGRVTWNNQDIYYVTNDICRPIETVSPYFPGLITEYAIKNYMYNMFYPLATFCNINVTNVANINQLYCSNVTVNGDAIFNSNVFINQNLVGGRIGIGTAPFNQTPLANLQSNLVIENIHIDESLYVGGNIHFEGNLVANNAGFHDVQGCKFGIGPCSGSGTPTMSAGTGAFYCDTLEVGSNLGGDPVVATINGVIIANNINPVSDSKLKKNIYRCPSSVVEFPEVVSYSYINDDKRRLGFLAQELEALYPEAIIDGKFYKMMFKKPTGFACTQIHNKKCILGTNGTDYHLTKDDFFIIGNKLVGVLDCTPNEIIIDYESYEDVLFIDGIIYEQVKMIDYTQVLMLLVQQVKELKSQIQQKTG